MALKTRAQALRDLGLVIAEIAAQTDHLTPREAAERAWGLRARSPSMNWPRRSPPVVHRRAEGRREDEGQALHELGTAVAEFTGAFMMQTAEEAAQRAWRPDGPFTLEGLAVKCAALQAKLRRGAAPTEERPRAGAVRVIRRGL